MSRRFAAFLVLLPLVGVPSSVAVFGAPKGTIDGCPRLPLERMLVGWNSGLDFANTEKLLRTDEVVKVTPLRDFLLEEGKVPAGSLPSFLITFKSGLRAVVKPDAHGKLAQAEEDGYRFSRLVPGDLVPPTVRRTFSKDEIARVAPSFAERLGGKISSVQYYIASKMDLLKEPDLGRVLSLAGEKDLSDKRIFEAVFGQWDNHDGNMILDPAYKIGVFDLGGMKDRQARQFGDYPFVLWSKTRATPATDGTGPIRDFPFEKAKSFKDLKLSMTPQGEIDYGNPQIDQLVKAFEGEIPRAQIARIWKRIAKGDVKIVYWKGGVWVQMDRSRSNFESKYRFDEPGTSVFYQTTLDAYAKLTKAKLKAQAPDMPDGLIDDILWRRDQMLIAAEKGKVLSEQSAPNKFIEAKAPKQPEAPKRKPFDPEMPVSADNALQPDANLEALLAEIGLSVGKFNEYGLGVIDVIWDPSDPKAHAGSSVAVFEKIYRDDLAGEGFVKLGEGGYKIAVNFDSTEGIVVVQKPNGSRFVALMPGSGEVVLSPEAKALHDKANRDALAIFYGVPVPR